MILSKTYENLQFESDVYLKLKEAELEAETTNKRFSSKDILLSLKKKIEEKQ